VPRPALAALTALLVLASPASAGIIPVPPEKGQQDCVNRLNADWLGVLKAQGKDVAGCLKDVAAGKAELEACLGADRKGKVAKAEAKTEKTDTEKCQSSPFTLPNFAYTSPAVLNASAKQAPLDSFDAIFGAAPNIVAKASDRGGAACQAEVLKRHAKLQETWAAEANKAKKNALSGSASAPAVTLPSELGEAIDAALSDSAKLAKAEEKATSGIAKKCDDALVADRFDCGGAATAAELSACVTDAAEDDACTAFELADAVPLSCANDALLVGAASRSVLPLVGGTYDYLAEGFPSHDDPYEMGIAVPAWDDGRIAVGNGETESYWVHDDLRASAVAIQRPGKREIVVIVATDLYMVFRIDADGIRAKAAALLGAELAADTRILVTATHNHHGPDTAFDVNHAWYEHMTDQVAAAIAEAVAERAPATLRTASGEHWFGAKDGTDPKIFDPSLNVLQATGTKGGVIATLVQWNNHPEATLGWSPPLEAIEDDCVTLGLVGDDCAAEGRYFTSDFPGVLREDMAAQYGGEVLFLNGALGVIVGPGGTQVWEVTPTHPLGDQMGAPAGAEAPGGGTDYTQENFRRPALIGEQLAAAVGRLLDDAETLGTTGLSYAVHPFYTRLSNIGFRVLTVVDENTGRSQLGHEPAPLFNCPDLGPKTDATCVDDAGEVLEDGLIGFSYRAGDHLKSAVEYVRLGPVGMMFLTGEIPGEITIGLPSGFRTTPEDWYDEAPGSHTFGTAFGVPGYVRRRMSDPHKWTIGLGSDQLGYHVPIANFRVLCVADEVSGPGACAALYAAGSIEYPDSLAGTTCKNVIENSPPSTPFLVTASCRYGQALGEAFSHYEETNSAGWDLVEDMMNAVAALTGNEDPTEVNPDFPGWWPGHLPPGDLP
jgi:hypothetical protein